MLRVPSNIIVRKTKQICAALLLVQEKEKLNKYVPFSVGSNPYLGFKATI
jgi:hypothetical protein